MTPADLQSPGVRRLIVTGHPNHELAIFGFVQRARPHFLFLTDGGAEARAGESRRALDLLGLGDQARFLEWREGRLYQALLDQDAPTFSELVSEVRREIEACAPRQILCESVEFYNPLHDITLPIVLAAAHGMPGIRVIEFPLIAQVPGPEERYRVQRPPATRQRDAVDVRLTDGELAAKLQARDQRYPSLLRELAGVFGHLGDQHASVEFFASARRVLPTPGPEHVLRYEWRGQRLKEQGRIERVITYNGHFLPAVTALGVDGN